MSEDPIVRRALRDAEAGARADASRLVASVPEMLRAARRIKTEQTAGGRDIAHIAAWAFPRLAALTAVMVIAASSYVVWEAHTAASLPAAESLILGGDDDLSLDLVLDALSDLEGNDG